MTEEEAKFVALRRDMVDTQLRARGIRGRTLLDAFLQTPRERFLPENLRQEAYADRPVPIGHGQTISQPFVVALMIQELDVQPHHRVLDVGAGSGYQTALLSRLARHVWAVERIEELTERSMAVIAHLSIDNVTICTGDGSLGWLQEAPFDRIICGAAAPDVPPAWIDQLAEGGRIVLPLGGEEQQALVAIEKRGGKIVRRPLCDVRFVKLIGRQGWPPSFADTLSPAKPSPR